MTRSDSRALRRTPRGFVSGSTIPRDAQSNVDLAIIVWALTSRPTLTSTTLAVLLQKPPREAADALDLAGRFGLLIRTARDGTWRLADEHCESLADELPYLRRTAAAYDEMIRVHLAQHREITRRDVVELANVSEAYAGKILSQAVERGLIRLPDGGPRKAATCITLRPDLASPNRAAAVATRA